MDLAGYAVVLMPMDLPLLLSGTTTPGVCSRKLRWLRRRPSREVLFILFCLDCFLPSTFFLPLSFQGTFFCLLSPSIHGRSVSSGVLFFKRGLAAPSSAFFLFDFTLFLSSFTCQRIALGATERLDDNRFIFFCAFTGAKRRG